MENKILVQRGKAEQRQRTINSLSDLSRECRVDVFGLDCR